MKIVIAALMLSASLTAALAFNYGGDGTAFGHMGASVIAGTGGGGGGCTMSGIYDLTNTCNDIYLIGRRI